MKRGLLIVSLALVSILFLSLVSASWFSDFLGKITGKAIVNNMNCPDNLVAYYRFEGNANDYLGNANGVLEGDASASGSLNLDGDNDWVDISKVLLQNITNATYSFWVYVNPTSSDNTQDFLSPRAGNSNDCYEVRYSPSKNVITWLTNNQGVYTPPVYIYNLEGKWTYIAITWGSTNSSLYINGDNVKTGGYVSCPAVMKNLFRIGKNQWDGRNYDFNGSIDEVAIFNRALSASEINDIYQKGISGNVCSCTEIWSCSAWSSCSNNTQTRTCIDANNCGTTTSKPVESQNCSFPILSCTDSDGGLNYYVKGGTIQGEIYEFSGGGGGFDDKCKDSEVLREGFCENNFAREINYTCPDGCSDGACVNASAKCNSLINKVKNPQDFSDDYGNLYSASWNYSYSWKYWFNGEETDVNSYQAGWYSYRNQQSYYPSYSINQFENNEVAKSYLENNVRWQLCRTSQINGDDVYICSYYYKEREENVRVLWINNNRVFEFYGGKSKVYDDSNVLLESQMKLNQFMERLKNNYYEWAEGYLPYEYEMILADDLKDCSSEVLPLINPETNETCSSCWSCKIEPVICPEHGYQTRICIDSCCNQEKREEQISCSPGICSGCTMPKWFGSDWDSKCVPYGFRFEMQEGDEDKNQKLGEGLSEDGRINLTIIDSENAKLYFILDNGYSEYDLKKNQYVSIWLPEFQKNIDYVEFYIKDIVPSNDNETGYILFDIKVLGHSNAYCDIDGYVKQQKIKEYGGNWAKCQNSYECESNLCSGGECVEINDLLKQTSVFKSIGVKVLCKLASVFGIEESYEQCVANYLGPPTPTPATPSGGGGGAVKQ